MIQLVIPNATRFTRLTRLLIASVGPFVIGEGRPSGVAMCRRDLPGCGGFTRGRAHVRERLHCELVSLLARL